jgi:hypothetical protein
LAVVAGLAPATSTSPAGLPPQFNAAHRYRAAGNKTGHGGVATWRKMTGIRSEPAKNGLMALPRRGRDIHNNHDLKFAPGGRLAPVERMEMCICLAAETLGRVANPSQIS